MQKKDAKGFTLIEVLLVIAITGIIGTAVIPFGADFLVRHNLENKKNETVSFLRTAQANTLAGKADQAWGVEITANQIKLFGQNSTEFDQIYPIPGSIAVTPVTIIFNRADGTINSSENITLTGNNGETQNIQINVFGVVSVQ